jgi:hypothetical protein
MTEYPREEKRREEKRKDLSEFILDTLPYFAGIAGAWLASYLTLSWFHQPVSRLSPNQYLILITVMVAIGVLAFVVTYGYIHHGRIPLAVEAFVAILLIGFTCLPLIS